MAFTRTELWESGRASPPGNMLSRMVEDKFIKGLPTEELMEKYSSSQEKACLGMVALFDVEEKLLKEVIRDRVFLGRVLKCRRKISKILSSKARSHAKCSERNGARRRPA